jgi:lysozyme
MTLLFGLDISHHQDERLDLARAKREGIAYVILKATEGTGWTDPEFAGNLAEARAAGLLVAAYHYQRPGSAARQADHIASVVPREVPVILDVEKGSGRLDLTHALVDELTARGYRVPLLYLPRWYWQQIGSPSLAGLPPLWSSRYPDMVVGSLADEWDDVPDHYWNGYGGQSVELLQFTSSSSIAGHYPIDANAYRGSRQELAALFGKQEDDMPYSEEDLALFAYRGSVAALQDAAYQPTTHAYKALRSAVTPIVSQQIAPLRGEIAGIAEAYQQLAGGREVNLDAVREAARAGVEQALAEGTVDVDIEIKGGTKE